MFFGRFALGILFLSSSSLFGAEVSLSKSIAEPGEPIVVSIKTESDKEIKPLETEFERNGVKAYYQGFSSETQIINFKVYRTQKINFVITERREGKHLVPLIRISLDGKVFTIPELSFEVKKGKQKPNPFGTLFGEKGGESREVAPEVKFHTNKSSVYTNELLVGYFVLYHHGMKQPFLERNPNQSISFPFFVSEILPNVTIEMNDSQFDAIVYDKEIYSLTPLKAGTFTLGKTQFLVGDSLRFGNFHEATTTIPEKIQVKPLPKPEPALFQGAVGEYEVSAKILSKECYAEEPIFFEILVQGRGGSNGISLPPVFQITEQKSLTRFKTLDTGENDFFTEVRFVASLLPTSQPKFQPPTIRLSYFSPREKAYKETSFVFPTLNVLEKREKKLPLRSEKTPPSWDFPEKGLLGFLFGFVFLAFFVNWIRRREALANIGFLDEKLGKKRGILLKEALENLGFPPEDREALVSLRSAFSDRSLVEIYKLCDRPLQRKILSISKKSKSMGSNQ